MPYSEWLKEKHKPTPEDLKKIEEIESKIDPKFRGNLMEYKRWLLSILEQNPEYANNPIVLEEIKKQNERLLRVFSRDFWKNKVTWKIMQATNDDIEMDLAA